MKVGVVVLSRYNSSRLPGKALKEIKGKPVLTYILERLQKVFNKENIVLATSGEITDEPIVTYAKNKGVNYYKGSLSNVSERFYEAAMVNKFDYAVRINGDNIFVDTDLLLELKLLAETDKYDFISNVKGRTFPKGMSIEIVRTSYYGKLLSKINTSSKYKEHVTLYLYEKISEKGHFYKYNTELRELEGIQLALDVQEDFERTCRIIEEFTKPHIHYNLMDICEILKKINYV